MKQLRPITIMTLGPLMLGFVFIVICAVGIGKPDLPKAGFSFITGAIFGLVMFAPFAIAEGLGQRISRLPWHILYKIQWHVSLLMAVGMGYMFGSMRHGTFDTILVIALLLYFWGAMAKQISRLPRHLWFKIQWDISLLVAVGMGYMFASMRHGTIDTIFVTALLLVFFGAMVKLVLGIVFASRQR